MPDAGELLFSSSCLLMTSSIGLFFFFLEDVGVTGSFTTVASFPEAGLSLVLFPMPDAGELLFFNFFFFFLEDSGVTGFFTTDASFPESVFSLLLVSVPDAAVLSFSSSCLSWTSSIDLFFFLEDAGVTGSFTTDTSFSNSFFSLLLFSAPDADELLFSPFCLSLTFSFDFFFFFLEDLGVTGSFTADDSFSEFFFSLLLFSAADTEESTLLLLEA
mmetsp:Transcript_20929/g.25912  ORF Transcript_20929/g.25912 Transcript_20929/m.25912 type:complete len:216 (+) Transcript_20929:3280-3927(+)